MFPNRPARHASEQLAVVSARLLPKRPGGQSSHTPPPPTLNFPAAHATGVALVDPGGHAYPGAHGPAHDGDVRPVTFPNLPLTQGPLQAMDPVAGALPKRPRGHALQTEAAPALYFPGSQGTEVAFVEPAGHT